MPARPLNGKIAVVAGATRAAGRGIARMLGEAGATVYCSGRSTRGYPATPGRLETIEETAELVSAAGGRGIAVRADHSNSEDVAALFARVISESGRIDVLVNDIWGGDDITEWQPFWTLDTAKGFEMLDRAVRTHIVTSRAAAPHMVERKSGLIVEITDGDHAGYRGTLFYDLAKMATIRLAFAMAEELRGHGCCCARGDARFPALRGHAGPARRERSELARRRVESARLRGVGVAVLCRPGRCSARGRSERRAQERRRVRELDAGAGVWLSPISTAPRRIGATTSATR